MIRLLMLVILVGCGNSQQNTEPLEPQETTPLILSMNLPKEDSYYVFDYPTNRPHTYTSVQYDTEPITRVFWTSPDSFTIVHQGFPITDPIINYSTYSRDDGSGKQMIYIDENSIGKTFTIYGCVEGDKGTTKEDNFEGCTKLKFKVR